MITSNSGDSHDEEVLAAGVVGTVHDGAHWQSQRHPKLGANGTSASSLRHTSILNQIIIKS